MTLEQNIRAVVECAFSESRQDLQDISVKNIMTLVNNHYADYISRKETKKAISDAVLRKTLNYQITVVDDVMRVIDNVPDKTFSLFEETEEQHRCFRCGEIHKSKEEENKCKEFYARIIDAFNDWT